jgi:hypothetical protein
VLIKRKINQRWTCLEVSLSRRRSDKCGKTENGNLRKEGEVNDWKESAFGKSQKR